MNYTERFPQQGLNSNLKSSTPVAPPIALASILEGPFVENLLEDTLDSDSGKIWDDIILGPLKEFLKVPGKSLRKDFVELGWKLAWTLKQKTSDHSQTNHSLNSYKVIPTCPKELILLVELLHAGSLIIDDIEDQSLLRRGQPCLHIQLGLPKALNLGNWLYFVSANMIETLTVDQKVKANLHSRLNRVMLRCHQGQAIDLSYQVSKMSRKDLKSVTELSTKLKTGVLVGFATQIGAIYLDLDKETNQYLYDFGETIGLSLQMYDDLSGLLNEKRWHKGCEDLGKQRLTWVWSLLAENSQINDQKFTELIEQLSNLSLEADKSTPSGTVSPSWQNAARSLQTDIIRYLDGAPQAVKNKISQAVEQLNKNLVYEDLSLITSKAIHKLQNSFI